MVRPDPILMAKIRLLTNESKLPKPGWNFLKKVITEGLLAHNLSYSLLLTMMADPYDTFETKDEKGISFVSLCKDFINYYKSFEEDAGLSSYNGADTCYVTFGISGAGKVRSRNTTHIIHPPPLTLLSLVDNVGTLTQPYKCH